ncbi:hypothetical protein Hanom_Chr04g00309491 [Helianthus anomalus]
MVVKIQQPIINDQRILWQRMRWSISTTMLSKNIHRIRRKLINTLIIILQYYFRQYIFDISFFIRKI